MMEFRCHEEAMPTSEFSKKLVLVAEDDPDDQMFIKETFDDYSNFLDLIIFKDGQELLDFLNSSKSLPSLIILDLNMPIKGGKQTLAEIRSRPETENVPVVILTTSCDPVEKSECDRLGASDFHVKSHNYLDIRGDIRKIIERWVLPGPGEVEESLPLDRSSS
jgi:CheY-like chemotaxis protein